MTLTMYRQTFWMFIDTKIVD